MNSLDVLLELFPELHVISAFGTAYVHDLFWVIKIKTLPALNLPHLLSEGSLATGTGQILSVALELFDLVSREFFESSVFVFYVNRLGSNEAPEYSNILNRWGRGSGGHGPQSNTPPSEMV